MIPFSTVKSVTDRNPIMQARSSWIEFADHLQAQSLIRGTDKANTPCICPAIYADGSRRAKANVAGWAWFAADIDNKPVNVPGATIEDVAERCLGMQVPFVIYTTSSHTDAAHRFRLMLPLDRLVLPDEFPAFWGSMAAWLGCLDPQTKDESRLFIAPRAWAGADFLREDGGTPLSVDLIKFTHPITVASKPRQSLTKAFACIDGLKPVCPSQVGLHGDFVTGESLARAQSGTPGTRMFPLLVRTGIRAMLKGYAITPDDLATIGHEFASSIGRDTGDINHDAMNAYNAALSGYAEIKASNLQKLSGHDRFLERWKRA